MTRWIGFAMVIALLPPPNDAGAALASTADSESVLIALPERVEQPLPASKRSALSEAKVGTWQVWFDPDQLRVPDEYLILQDDLDPDASSAWTYLPQSLWVELPERARFVQLEIREIHHVSPHVITYFGHLDGEHAYAVTITLNHVTDHVLARIHHGSRLYLIDERIEDNQAHLQVIDKRRLPEYACVAESEGHNDEVDAVSSSSSGFAISSSHDNGNVRAVFYYTQEVADNAPGGIDAMIDTIVAEMNSTTYSSGIDPKNYISAADRIQTGQNNFNSSIACGCCPIYDSDPDPYTSLLAKMSNEVGEFSQISSHMDAVYADIAVLLVSDDCDRIGGAILGSHDMNAPVPFTVITDDFALNDLTALHEFGHLLGSGHEITANQHPNPFPNAPTNARGFLEPNYSGSAQWQTMMGGYQTLGVCWYDHNQDPDNQSCVRLPMWSNPNRTYGGKPTGDSNAFNAQAFDSTMPTVASWGLSYPHAVPAAPALTAYPGYCYGFNSVSWSTPANTEIFQLFVDKPYPQGWERIHHGIGTQMNFNVPQSDGSWSLKVRACNGSGCSGFSNTVNIHYFHGCM